MKARLKTGEIIEIVPNDDFCAAKYINKETSEYIFDDEIAEFLNEEPNKAAIEYCPDDAYPFGPMAINIEVRKAFIAGAGWQKEQDTRDMYMSDNRHFEKVYELGKKDMKKKIMEDAVECELYYDGDFLAIDLNMAELGYSERDKVRIIIIPNTDEK